jgi:hypothetical protein
MPSVTPLKDGWWHSIATRKRARCMLKRQCPGGLVRERFYVDVSQNGIQIRR